MSTRLTASTGAGGLGNGGLLLDMDEMVIEGPGDQ